MPVTNTFNRVGPHEQHISFNVPRRFGDRIRLVAETRQVTLSQACRWLLDRAMTEYEALSREQREAL